ncbi:hypothetical protein EON65_42330 [archaeon]|nr:MAG: hypothetical protein EON65_42330 [archaeon]
MSNWLQACRQVGDRLCRTRKLGIHMVDMGDKVTSPDRSLLQGTLTMRARHPRLPSSYCLQRHFLDIIYHILGRKGSSLKSFSFKIVY